MDIFSVLICCVFIINKYKFLSFLFIYHLTWTASVEWRSPSSPREMCLARSPPRHHRRPPAPSGTSRWSSLRPSGDRRRHCCYSAAVHWWSPVADVDLAHWFASVGTVAVDCVEPDSPGIGWPIGRRTCRRLRSVSRLPYCMFLVCANLIIAMDMIWLCCPL